jgi:hypothetical protein
MRINAKVEPVLPFVECYSGRSDLQDTSFNTLGGHAELGTDGEYFIHRTWSDGSI